MDLHQFFGRNVLIRLTDDGEGFVCTNRYGPLYGQSTKWTVNFPEELAREPVVDDSLYSADEE